MFLGMQTSTARIKFVEYNFNLNYENIYHHYFYNHMNIFVGIADNKISVQASIGKYYNEKKDLVPPPQKNSQFKKLN